MSDTVHLGGLESECVQCVIVAGGSGIKCDKCDSLNADTYEHEGMTWNICRDCEEVAPTINDYVKSEVEGGE